MAGLVCESGHRLSPLWSAASRTKGGGGGGGGGGGKSAAVTSSSTLRSRSRSRSRSALQCLAVADDDDDDDDASDANGRYWYQQTAPGRLHQPLTWSPVHRSTPLRTATLRPLVSRSNGQITRAHLHIAYFYFISIIISVTLFSRMLAA